MKVIFFYFRRINKCGNLGIGVPRNPVGNGLSHYHIYYRSEVSMDDFFEELRNYCIQNPFSEENCEPWVRVAWNKGKQLSEEHKKSLSETHKKLLKFGNARSGIIFSEEHKRKLSEAAKNREPMTDQRKENLRQIALNRKPIYDTCPHCNYHGLKRVVYRYHRQNCKNLPN